MRIVRHAAALEALQAEIDGLSAQVETKTAQAGEKLLRYRALKEQAECALEDVASEYEQALSLFGQADELMVKLAEIKAEHVSLSELAVKRADAESVLKLREARAQLGKLYEEIEQLKAESLPAELAEKVETRG